MSERGYFSVRYLIPGSTFLLFVVAYNVFPLSILLKQQETNSLFGAIIALFSSPAIGYLTSQAWWWRLQSKIEVWNWSPVKALIKKYQLTESNEKEAKKKVLMIYDYVLHSEVYSEKGMAGLRSYCFRRWDNYVLLSCTDLTLQLGVVSGIMTRLAYEYFFKVPFWQNLFTQTWINPEFSSLLSLSIVAIALIFFIKKGKDWVKREYEVMHEAIIKDSKIKLEHLRTIFPPDYFQSITSKLATQ